MRLHAVGGLCNRLRAILSYRDFHGRITVVWEPDEYVSGGRFLDVFEPLDGVTFEDSGSSDAEDFGVHVAVKKGWQIAYRELRPSESVRKRLDGPDAARRLGVHYIAMHVRRTDHVPNVSTHQGKIAPLEEFVDWTAKHPRHTVYVATDNGETQARLRELLERQHRDVRYATVLEGAEEQGLEDHHRNGELSTAVVDLFHCAAAHDFKGTHGSSFSETIEILRQGLPWWAR